MKITFTVPKDGSEITINQFVAWGNSESDYDTVAAFTELSKEDINKLKYQDVEMLAGQIREALNKTAPVDVPRFLKYDGITYGLIPDFESITHGEFVSIEQAAKNEDLKEMFAIMYRPVTHRVGDKYRIEDYDHYKHNGKAGYSGFISLDVVNSLTLFFSSLGNELLKSTKSYLMEAAKKKIQS